MIRRVGLFALATLVSAVSGVLVIPVLNAAVGSEMWALVALGQAVGLALGVIVDWGWGVVGPNSTSTMPRGARGNYYANSWSARIIISLALILPSLAVAWFINEKSFWIIGLLIVGTYMGSLGGSWFFIGDANPKAFIAFVVAPRSIGPVLGALVSLHEKSIWPFAISTFAAALFSSITSALAIFSKYPIAKKTISSHAHEAYVAIRKNSSGVASSMSWTILSNLPTVVVGFLSPQGLPSFAISDKVVKFGMTATQPLLQVLQSWVPDSKFEIQKMKIKRISKIAIIASVFGLILSIVLFQKVTMFLSHGQITAPTGLVITQSLQLVVIFLSSLTGGIFLVSLGEVKSVASARIIGLGIGALLVPIGAIALSAEGASIGILIAQMAILCFQIHALSSKLALDVRND